MELKVGEMHFKDLNELIRENKDDYVKLDDVFGQRYIGCGLSGRTIDIHGTPGNALGAYMNDCVINVYGNGQDATGDTMNCGKIIIHGSCGDTTGYGMRGGEIFIKGSAGYRVGIHMKEYKELKPVIVVGGKAGDFLGEYLAGGILVVLGIGAPEEDIVGNFCGTGMHGGVIYIRGKVAENKLPSQVAQSEADDDDMKIIKKYIEVYCNYFGADKDELLKSKFYKLLPNSKNPYTQMYIKN